MSSNIHTPPTDNYLAASSPKTPTTITFQLPLQPLRRTPSTPHNPIPSSSSTPQIRSKPYQSTFAYPKSAPNSPQPKTQPQTQSHHRAQSYSLTPSRMSAFVNRSPRASYVRAPAATVNDAGSRMGRRSSSALVRKADRAGEEKVRGGGNHIASPRTKGGRALRAGEGEDYFGAAATSSIGQKMSDMEGRAEKGDGYRSTMHGRSITGPPILQRPAKREDEDTAPRRGRTRTVAPIIGSEGADSTLRRRWSSPDRVDMGLLDDKAVSKLLAHAEKVDPANEIGIGAGGIRLGLRQQERTVLTPCVSPPPERVDESSQVTMESVIGGLPMAMERSQPIAVPTPPAAAEHDREADRRKHVNNRKRRSASPRNTPPNFAAPPPEVWTRPASRTFEAKVEVEETVVVEDTHMESPQLVEDRSIEEAIGDAMESSIILPPAGDVSETKDTLKGKRKIEGEGGKRVGGKQRRANDSSRVLEGQDQTEDEGGTVRQKVAEPRSPLRALSMQDAGQPEEDRQLEAFARPATSMSTRSTRSTSITRRTSMDHLMNGFVPVVGGHAKHASMRPQKSLPRNPSSKAGKTMRPSTPIVNPDNKVMPSLVRSVTNIVITTAVSLPVVSEAATAPVQDTITQSRRASLSLKRIQDNDMETMMASSGNISHGTDSPVTQVEAAFRARGDNPTVSSTGFSWETLHKQNVLQRARSLGNDWIKKSRPALLRKPSRPAFGLGSPKSTLAPSRDPLTYLIRAASYAPASPSMKASPPDKPPKTARANSIDSTRLYTRWDGTRTPITQDEHPVHWAALKEHRLVRQQSKQDVRGRRSIDGTSDVFGSYTSAVPARGRGGEGNADRENRSRHLHSGNSPSLPPVSIDRWKLPTTRGHARGPSHLPSPNLPPNDIRPPLETAKTLPIPHASHFSDQNSPTFSMSGNSAASGQITSSDKVSLAGSFDSKAAYEAAKGAGEGMVSFDQVLGLNG